MDEARLEDRPAVRTEDLRRLYRMGETEVAALRSVDLAAIAPGEFVSVVGVSGSGKSTLLHLIGGLDSPTSGRIFVDGEELHTLGERQKSGFRRRKVGFIFQAFHLVPSLSARSNIELSLTIRGFYGARRRTMADEALDRVGLADRAEHRPGQLSGGEQQRVAIARAIVHRPPLLLADEPTGNLDSENAGTLVGLMREINRDSGTTVVMVTHDEELARLHSDRFLRLRDGRVSGEEAPLRLWQLILLAVESLRRARLRAALTTAGIAIATGALVSMVAFALGLQSEAEKPVEALGLLNNIEVTQRDASLATEEEAVEVAQLDEDAIARFESIEGVEIAYPEFRTGGILAISEHGRAEAIGLGVPHSPLLGSIFERVLCAGTFFTGDAEPQAIPGDLLVQQLGFESPEAALGQMLQLAVGEIGMAGQEEPTLEVRIVGVFTPPGMTWRLRPTAILLPTDVLRGARSATGDRPGPPGGRINRVTVRAAATSEVDRIAREIGEMGYDAFAVADNVKGMRAFFLFIEALLFAVGAVGLVIAGLGILNTLLMAVLERTSEIGLYRSMGATTGEVRTIFLVEAAALGLFGGLLGLLLARIVCSLLQAGIDYYMREQEMVFPTDAFLFSPWLLTGAVLFSIVVSVLSGVYPASRAARIDPIRALRGE